MRATGRTELVLVAGYSGIGKSSLVQELRRTVVGARGYFVSGKYDQYRRDIPYATLVQAFQELLRQILTESDERIQVWKAALWEGLGVNAQLIVDLIPQLELVLGPQPPVPTLLPSEAENRLHLVFQRFLRVFARQEHPLVLFLDDLQWLDLASLRLLAFLLTSPDRQALLLIGAYRDNEVGPSHPLTGALEEIRRSGVCLRELVLEPLSPAHLTQLVADTLRRPAEEAAPLAQLIHDKTEGNPFFAIHFLSTLYREGLVVYDGDDGRWHWDLDAIRRQGFTDNVVELMLGKLKRLPTATQEALTSAACIGNTVDARTLALLTDLTEDQLHVILREALHEGLLSRVDASYTFLHDRVQEAAYALLDPAHRPARHLRIGRLLLAHTPQEELAENIFEIAGQLNRGTSLISSAAEKERLAELNLLAGKRAKAATAFALALDYLTVGTTVLGPAAWDSSYELAFTLQVERAECEYLVGNFACSEELLALALDHARCLLDQVWVYRLRQRLYQHSGRWPEAMSTSLEALRLFGISLPEGDAAIWTATDAEIALVEVNLRGRRIADLADIPFTDDAEMRALIGLLAEAMPLIYVMRPLLWPLITARGVNLCLRHGHAEESPFVYSCYAMVLVGICHDIPSALQFSRDVPHAERAPSRSSASGGGSCCFTTPPSSASGVNTSRTSLPLLDQAFHACLDSGDLVYVGYLTYHAIWLHLENGDPLERVVELARPLCGLRSAEPQRHRLQRQPGPSSSSP